MSFHSTSKSQNKNVYERQRAKLTIFERGHALKRNFELVILVEPSSCRTCKVNAPYRDHGIAARFLNELDAFYSLLARKLVR